MGHALPGLTLGVNDVVHADALEDLAVRLRDRLGPDLRHPQIDKVSGDEHTRLDRGTGGHDRDLEVRGAYLAQRLDRLGIGLHRVGHAIGPFLHEGGIGIDHEHLAVLTVELTGGRGAETAESDHDYGCV